MKSKKAKRVETSKSGKGDGRDTFLFYFILFHKIMFYILSYFKRGLKRMKRMEPKKTKGVERGEASEMAEGTKGIKFYFILFIFILFRKILFYISYLF